MAWDQGDGKVCGLIRDRKTGSAVKGDDYESFQVLVSSLRAFEAVGLLEQVKVLDEHHTGHRYAAAAVWKIHPSVFAGSISTSQRRWLLLRFFAAKYDEDDSRFYVPSPQEFADLMGPVGRITQVCDWLKEQGFIRWQPMFGPEGGCGQILDKGYEALEGGLEFVGGTGAVTAKGSDQRNLSINVGQLHVGSGDLAIGPGATIIKDAQSDKSGKPPRTIEVGQGLDIGDTARPSVLRRALRHPLTIAVVTTVITVVGTAIAALLSVKS
ncbi:hypothetical protein [Thauera humireducens]|uniref:hypothetical protein n=1 Tax=Thauera humireducens TaxID=1134435 RepID=UPI000AD692F5|nr:hypothetical protein [Thauera humireducens]